MENVRALSAAAYDDDCFGHYMSDNFIVLCRELSVKQAMRSLVAQAADCDNIDMLFIVDSEDKYVGAIDLKDLIVAREATPLGSLIDADYPFVLATRPIDENIEQLKTFAKGTLPVLDEAYRLEGIISVEDMLDILDEEMGEDYAKLAGLTDEEDLEESLGRSMQKRLPWLAVLLVLGLIISTVIGAFEKVIEQLTLVVCFQSLILGMAGNAGTQSLAVTVRILSDNELSGRDRAKLIFKEIRVGFVGGGLLGLLAFVGIGVYILLLQGESAYFSFAVSGCIGIALWGAMILSAAAGTLIPLGFKSIGLDPAVASGPLITTLNDLAAVVIYYGLAWLLLIQVMGFGT